MKALIPVLLGLIVTGCASHLNAPGQPVPLPETNWTVEASVRYSPPDWPEPLYADIYRPQGAGPHPAVLTVHGGGWTNRSRADMTDIAETLAGHGFAVMNIDYRFTPDHRFPAQLQDLQQAMHWLHRQADDLDIDTGRVAGFGYSSGAHLVSLLALVAAEGGELDRPYGGPQTRLAAVVAGGTPSDLRKFGSGRLVEQLLGGTMAEVPARYAAASPVTHITDTAPPFFLYHGSWDGLVPVDHATDFQAALASEGVPTEMMILRWRGHIASFLTGQGAVDAGVQFLYRTLVPEAAEPVLAQP
ncbi:alpha/beta hydrolase [Marinobacter bohaiensis]|uniref:alpha/beta hydrolase n=1 Tax=Marinobacter bohaiensis TaxID=2201898 RepID=UPI000DAC0342|nr:alpha/beta hydrolase [Marinobacter bohaiensis]